MESKLDINEFVEKAKTARQNGIKPYNHSIVYMQQLGRELDSSKEQVKETEVKSPQIMDSAKQKGESDDRDL